MKNAPSTRPIVATPAFDFFRRPRDRQPSGESTITELGCQISSRKRTWKLAVDIIKTKQTRQSRSSREVLREIREDERLRLLPVIVLTTSNDERDVLAAYSLLANCYITKPVDMDQFVATMRAFEGFWLTWVTFPPDPAD